MARLTFFKNQFSKVAFTLKSFIMQLVQQNIQKGKSPPYSGHHRFV